MEFQAEDGYLGISICETKEEKAGLNRERSQLSAGSTEPQPVLQGVLEISIDLHCLRLG